MAIWTPPPDKPVGANEYVGRRIFARNGLKGAGQQTKPKGAIELYHFEDSRGDLSLDRLGATSIDKKVVRRLHPLCDDATQKFNPPRPFLGWFSAHVKAIRAIRATPPLEVSASPIKDQVGEKDNPYHSHISTPEKMDPQHFALLVKYAFEQGETIAVESEGTGAIQTSPSILERFKVILRMFKRWLRA